MAIDQAHAVLHRHAPPSHAAHNKLGSTALVFAVVGTLAGAIAFLFPVALVCGLLGGALGVGAVRRVRSGVATNARTATVALVLGVLAVVLGCVGFLVSVVATDSITPPSETTSSSTR